MRDDALKTQNQNGATRLKFEYKVIRYVDNLQVFEISNGFFASRSAFCQILKLKKAGPAF
jgi:hypothetical protein